MPHYIVLANYTEQGVKTIKDLGARTRARNEAMEQHGVKQVASFITMGQYDVVTIVEAPDDETMARFLLSVGQRGNVRTSTLKAWPRDEFIKIAESLG